MAEYAELVKLLRSQADDDNCSPCPYEGWAVTPCFRCVNETRRKAADAIEEMQQCLDGIEADNDSLCAKLEELSKPHWISVMERLPEEENVHVLVWCPRFRNIFMAYVHNREWLVVGWRGSDKVGDTIYGRITHWRHLPEPPKEET